MVQIKLPKSLTRFTSGDAQIEVQSTTLQDALIQLTERFSLGHAVLQENGTVQPYIRIAVGDKLLDNALLSDAASIDITDQIVQLKTAFAGG